ncbi:hypothetical protein N8000_07280 [Rhodospirillales bacterium]|nr:hypothetical protein [Rhodospirillales bacterium]
MLYNKDTKTFGIVVLGEDTNGKFDFTNGVTTDGIKLVENYTLEWIVDGFDKTHTLKFSGEELLRATMVYNSDRFTDMSFREVRSNLAGLASYYFARLTSKSLFNSLEATFEKHLVKRAVKGFRKDKGIVRESIAAYMYIKLTERDADDKNCTVVQVKDNFNAYTFDDLAPDAKQHFPSSVGPDSLLSFFGGVQVSFKEAA